MTTVNKVWIEQRTNPSREKAGIWVLQGQLASGDEIALTELSANLPTLNGRPFVTFTEDQDYGLEETGIPPKGRSSLKTLTKFSGSGKVWH